MPKEKQRHELEAMTKDELVAFADDIDVDVQQSWLKDDIITAILKGQKEAKANSTTHNEERRAKMEKESNEKEQDKALSTEEREAKQAERDRKSRFEEDQLLTQHANLIQPGETRDQLLDRIREMRENPPKPPEPMSHMTDYQKSQLELEQKAGADAVKQAEKGFADAAEHRKKVEEERLAREGTMTGVHHPNPGQNEQFPAQNATLGKRK